MKGYTHIAGGLLFGFLFGVKPYALPLVVIGSTFPDIDLKFSSLVPPKGKKKSLFNTHRGITHHPFWAVALLTLWGFLENRFPQYEFYWEFLYAFWVGYLSHLVLDALTPLGIPVGTSYYPRLKIPLMKTGGVGERFFAFLLVLSLVGILYLKANA
ncbi:MAG TPA: metal-dependent hydrolase [Aquifex aeolicus]|uniref:Metal-dependent hydrolase n=1 Tax=Aquifex aeolicus TaxID=63363 RepID=A0A9D0YS48_AQUAO|nr:metal-dependent hydrolase [Aquificales bacterium]HIP86774.1 metal-dependent hydrolase [Aquifex sp.]HIP98732.1 metal-dependent hydrolase [Aquifex aeolicus]HIQ26721.1 metal-dependent hydrolase [Aquifex aeolicus]